MNRITLIATLSILLLFITYEYLSPGLIFMVFMSVGVWFFPASLVNDEFWFLRKRLWTTGTFWVQQDDVAEHDPFIWSSLPVQKGTDVSHLL